ncbi:alpha-(1-_6)-mannopyranosyltransferase A [Corynebacterium sp. H128]|uniref:alpha-(1->6)-mannopyranosyltransferase A n=1 Tax=unclassified Corynebacterium TaxID=2624378 RepID=UPI0030A18B90
MTSFLRTPWLGLLSACLITIASFGAGAIRNRGGVLEHLGLSLFAYGHGAALSNALLWVGMLGMIAAWVVLGRRLRLEPAAITAGSLRRVLIWWIAPLTFAAPILSRDVYSYLMQGAMLRDGFDPYTQGAAINPGPMLLEVSHDWRNTTTPYGPLHLWIGEIITSIVGDNVTLGVVLYKVVSICGFLMIAWSVPRIATELGADPRWALWLGVANPVMIFHLIGGMHNESLMVGLVSVGVLCAIRDRFVPAVVLVAISVSLKATAVFALPFMVWMAMRKFAHRTSAEPSIAQRCLAFVLSGVWMTALTVAVVGAVTWASGASWGWISQISGNSKVINPLALPSFVAGVLTPIGQLINEDIDYNNFLVFTRPISQVLMLVGLVTVWWIFRKNRVRAVMGIVAAYAVAVVFNAVTLPWYYTSLLNLVGTFPQPVKVRRLTTMLSVVIAASFTGSGNHMLYNITWMAGVVVGAWLLTQFVFGEEAAQRSA